MSISSVWARKSQYPQKHRLSNDSTPSMLCYSCESLVIPIVASGQTLTGVKFSPSLRGLSVSAKTCSLCHLVHTTLQDVRTKGIKNDAIQLFSWASDAQGDPIGMSRVVVMIGKDASRFIDVYATESMPHGSKVCS